MTALPFDQNFEQAFFGTVLTRPRGYLSNQCAEDFVNGIDFFYGETLQ
jgi:hypothetical protein